MTFFYSLIEHKRRISKDFAGCSFPCKYSRCELKLLSIKKYPKAPLNESWKWSRWLVCCISHLYSPKILTSALAVFHKIIRELYDLFNSDLFNESVHKSHWFSSPVRLRHLTSQWRGRLSQNNDLNFSLFHTRISVWLKKTWNIMYDSYGPLLGFSYCAFASFLKLESFSPHSFFLIKKGLFL